MVRPTSRDYHVNLLDMIRKLGVQTHGGKGQEDLFLLEGPRCKLADGNLLNNRILIPKRKAIQSTMTAHVLMKCGQNKELKLWLQKLAAIASAMIAQSLLPPSLPTA